MGKVVLLPLPPSQDSPEWRRVAAESLQYAKGLFSELIAEPRPLPSKAR